MKKVISVLLTLMVALAFITGCSGGSAPQPGTDASDNASAGESEFPDIPMPRFTTVEIVHQLPDSPKKIAVLGFMNNTWWNIVKDGFDIGAEYLKNFNVDCDYIICGDHEDAKTINAALESTIVQGYDGVVVIAFPAGTAAYVDKVEAAGIPVVTAYAEDPTQGDDRFMFIGTRPTVLGEVSGEAALKWIQEHGGTGSYGIIANQFDYAITQQYISSFEEMLEGHDGITHVGTFAALDQTELNYTYAIDLITANPDLKVIYCCGGGPVGAARAVEALGKTGEIIVIGQDAVEECFDYMRKGIMQISGNKGQKIMVDGMIYLYNKIVADQNPPEKKVLSDKSSVAFVDIDSVDYWEGELIVK